MMKDIHHIPGIQAAFAYFDDSETIIQTTIAIQQIPAPTFDEAQRAAYICDRMHAINLHNVFIDDIHNVYGMLPGSGSGTCLLIAAHIDTVFPIDTDLAIRREGSRIYGPGIGDNCLGVAGMLHLAHAIQQYAVPHNGDIWFVANVGEEGLGDLRGMRAAVDFLKDKIDVAIALEGCDVGRIFHEAISVRRYKITVHAPGGHSWGNFGAPSAIHTLVHIAESLTQLVVPQEPRTTFNIGTVEGGTSINAIAQRASLLLDLRSEDAETLMSLITHVETIIAEARSSVVQGVRIDLEQVGDRPGGRIDRAHLLVRAAAASLQSVGISAHYDSGSTDANIPLSRGIPAVCVAIGDGEHAHRLDEYIETHRISAGMRALLLLTLAATDPMTFT